MDELNQTAPGAVESSDQNKSPEKALSQIEQEQAGQQQKQSAIAIAETKETLTDRKSAIEAFIVESDFLGFDPKDEGMMEAMTEALLSIEGNLRNADPAVDITEKPAMLLKIMLKKEIAKNKNVEQSESYKEILSDKSKTVLEKLSIGANDEHSPKELKAQWKAYLKITSLAQTPEDKAVIEQKINSQNLSNLPDPITFIQAEIFGDPETTGHFRSHSNLDCSRVQNNPL